MAWTCNACTFENSDENSKRCEICTTQRKRPATDKTLSFSSSVQSTLFGGTVTTPPPPAKRAKKSEKINNATKQPALLPLSFAPTSVRSTVCSDDVPLTELKAKAEAILKNVFQIQKLRNLQPKSISLTLKKRSQTLCMATGGGKSLCYQLPALVLGGTTIVISPLIALMTDQVQALIARGIQAAVISSANGERRNLEVMERLLGRSLKVRPSKNSRNDLKTPVSLLYCTPEQIQTEKFRSILTELHQKNQLALFAIDEAHCLSSWGHDFRPAYRQLTWFRDTFPDVPCLACTATATPQVLTDIQQTLRLSHAPCLVGTFDRKNVFYKVRYKDCLPDARIDLVQYIRKQHARADQNGSLCSGIVYVHKREETTELAKALCETGIPAAAYHGGMPAGQRDDIQKQWTQGSVKVAIATIAFGMGIDLAHVRYVIHWNMSKTVEAFYQESGRAGRDGLPAYSVLYYCKSDASKFEYLLRQRKNDKNKTVERALEALKKMVDYCIRPACRRAYLLKHFGEKDAEKVCNRTCDYCSNPEKVKRAIEAMNAVNDFSFHTSLSSKAFGTKNDNNGLGIYDVDDYEPVQGDWDVDGLRITGAVQDADDPSENYEGRKPTVASFQSALSILDKYEAIECKSQKKDTGFVSYKSKKPPAKIRNPVAAVPQHFVQAVPTRTVPSKKEHVSSSSKEIQSEADRLLAELAQARADLAAKKKAFQENFANR